MQKVEDKMVLCLTTFSTTAFAGGGENTAPPVPEQTEKPTPVPLTPEGNLTLVDDVERTDEIHKQHNHSRFREIIEMIG